MMGRGWELVSVWAIQDRELGIDDGLDVKNEKWVHRWWFRFSFPRAVADGGIATHLCISLKSSGAPPAREEGALLLPEFP
jgi:hypothetical protein